MTENIRNGSVRMQRGNVQKSLLALSMEEPEPGRPERGLHACVSTSHEAPLGPAVCHQYGFSADESSPSTTDTLCVANGGDIFAAFLAFFERFCITSQAFGPVSMMRALMILVTIIVMAVSIIITIIVIVIVVISIIIITIIIIILIIIIVIINNNIIAMSVVSVVVVLLGRVHISRSVPGS